MSTFKTHMDVRSDHIPITATEMKKWKGQKIGNDSLFLIFIYPPQPIIKNIFKKNRSFNPIK